MSADRPPVVVLGMMTKIPVAGVVWQTLHYLIGLERLGFAPYYVEAHGRTPSMLMSSDAQDPSDLAAAFLARTLGPWGMGDRWSYQVPGDPAATRGLDDAAVTRVLARAEVAMYAAKARQCGSLIYHAQLDAGSQESLSLLSELRRAVESNELRLFLQPKVDLVHRRVVGAEALVRWQHPERGVLAPVGFVPFAEQTGFVRLLTRWMIDEVARTAQGLIAQGLAMKLAVNLSTRDLLDPDLPQRLGDAIARHHLPPGSIVLEITESAIMDDPQRAQHTLQRLRAMGLRLSIDDFGTGHSSLAYLKTLPVQELKLDRSFVMSMGSDEHDAKIVQSTVALAHSLGLSVVAEGVESLATRELLQALGCDEAQGHLIAKPMPASQFADWVADRAGSVLPADADAVVRTTMDPRMQAVAEQRLVALLDGPGVAADATMRANGWMPIAFAFVSDITMTAAAPSLSGHELDRKSVV